jgi:hypothetical protein
MLPVVTPGTRSFTQIVAGNYFTRGKIDIGGVALDAFVSVVPEPEVYALLIAGLGLIGTIVRRRKASQA